jgi:ATP-binding cassette subfamily B protein
MLLAVTAVDAVLTVAVPLAVKGIIGYIQKGELRRVQELAILIAVVAIADAFAVYAQGWYSFRIAQGMTYELRTRVYAHVQKQPLAFFGRTQTGSLVSRVNGDVLSAQSAIGSILSQTLDGAMTLAAVVVVMIYLSPQLTLIAAALVPFFLIPGRLIGKRLQRLTRTQMQLTASLQSLMSERFNVAGATLARLYGRPSEELRRFKGEAGRIRDVATASSAMSRVYSILLTLVAALAMAIAYGVGGALTVEHQFTLATLVTMVMLLNRTFGPINKLSNTQVNVFTALVAFDRVFEVLDLKPLVRELPEAYALPYARGGAPDIEFDHVWFRYPSPSEVSVASLEAHGRPRERAGTVWNLKDVSFVAPAGQVTALVGPSGAGKSTISSLVPRLYDPSQGAVLISGHDIRGVTFESLHATVGVVSQDPHLFHDTIRANLAYARPDASERDLIEACQAAQVWDVVAALPNGLDTVVAERGTRLSGGEKQRICIARLLLKAPSVIILDEATSSLDSESEAAVQRALETVMLGRTSIVIAHRLSTVREAHQILVISDGQIAERGTHDELLAWDGLYAKLYLTQFAPEPPVNGVPLPGPHPAAAAVVSWPGLEAEPTWAPPDDWSAIGTRVPPVPSAGQFVGGEWVPLPAQEQWRVQGGDGRHRHGRWRPGAKPTSRSQPGDAESARGSLARLGVDPDSLRPVLRLASLGLVRCAWRDTCVGSWRAEGRLRDGDMLRVNSHMSWRLDQFLWHWHSQLGFPPDAPARSLDEITLDEFRWLCTRVYQWIVNPERRLPVGTTLGNVARESLNQLKIDADDALTTFLYEGKDLGIGAAFQRAAAHGGSRCGHWWGHPGWAPLVAAFTRVLDDPRDAHWGSRGEFRARLPAEPPLVRDREGLRQTLLLRPWTLDHESAQWVVAAGIRHARRAEVLTPHPARSRTVAAAAEFTRDGVRPW